MALRVSSCFKRPIWICPTVLILCALLIVFVHQSSNALVMTRDGCDWPKDWPKTLDQVRDSCRTIEIAAGNQEDVFEIVFDDRKKFEGLWPSLLTVKTPGAPFRLFTVGSPTISIFSNARPAVRIFAPAYSSKVKHWGTPVRVGLG